jgi:hypothetical protein
MRHFGSQHIFWVCDPECLSSSSAPYFQIIFSLFTTLLTGMTGISLDMAKASDFSVAWQFSNPEQLPKAVNIFMNKYTLRRTTGFNFRVSALQGR